MKRYFQKTAISMLAMLMAVINVQIPLAQAAIVGTEQVMTRQQADSEREKVIAFLNRAEVQQELQQQGVSSLAAQQRVAHLSDAEVQMLAGKIDQLPAGGFIGEIIGAAVFIFLVLLVTDILGFTNVYPFVHHR
ncbi:MAG: hypothetical protein AUJ57_00275 [Zetaproteobacteria bacterium CG1_02_53_45]|nr:MAG: hypothetical protein AUJ57_00275 [Zetaproteobacteria bacterium CG1_02_53_45]